MSHLNEIRATMLSMLNFLRNAILIPLSLLLSGVAQHSTIFNAYSRNSAIGLI